MKFKCKVRSKEELTNLLDTLHDRNIIKQYSIYRELGSEFADVVVYAEDGSSIELRVIVRFQ